MKLHPDDLDVTSFDTSPELEQDASTSIIPPNDPTPATYCRICPVGTDNCY